MKDHMEETVQVNFRLERSTLKSLKAMSLVTHDGRYQTLIKDILKAYLKVYKHVRPVSRKTREVEKEVMDFVIKSRELEKLEY